VTTITIPLCPSTCLFPRHYRASSQRLALALLFSIFHFHWAPELFRYFPLALRTLNFPPPFPILSPPGFIDLTAYFSCRVSVEILIFFPTSSSLPSLSLCGSLIVVVGRETFENALFPRSPLEEGAEVCGTLPPFSGWLVFFLVFSVFCEFSDSASARTVPMAFLNLSSFRTFHLTLQNRASRFTIRSLSHKYRCCHILPDKLFTGWRTSWSRRLGFCTSLPFSLSILGKVLSRGDD